MSDRTPTSGRWLALVRGSVATATSAASAAGCGLLTRESGQAVAALPGARPDEAVVLLAAGLATVAFAWLALLLLLATVAVLPGGLGGPGRRASQRLAPVWGRRLSAVVLGVVVASSVASAAHAGPAAGAGATRAGGAAGVAGSSLGFTTVTRVVGAPSCAPDPGWTAPPPPRRQRGAPAALVTTTPRPGWRADGAAEEVVVRRGDSLWSIAARHLGPHATPAQVAAQWPRWYAANAHLIGADPARILPGQVLRAPTQPGDAVRTTS